MSDQNKPATTEAASTSSNDSNAAAAGNTGTASNTTAFPSFVFEGHAAGQTSFGKAVPSTSNNNVIPSNPDIHVTPIVTLPEVEVKTGEEDEEIIYEVRAKLFRWGLGNAGMQWKERGTGPLKLLKHKDTGRIRLLMRRDKTLKVAANHEISEDIELEKNASSDRSFTYKVLADFSDDEPCSCVLAVRLKDKDVAAQFADEFNKAQKHNIKMKGPKKGESEAEATDELTDAVANLDVKSEEGSKDAESK